jgi:hypothetical protein
MSDTNIVSMPKEKGKKTVTVLRGTVMKRIIQFLLFIIVLTSTASHGKRECVSKPTCHTQATVHNKSSCKHLKHEQRRAKHRTHRNRVRCTVSKDIPLATKKLHCEDTWKDCRDEYITVWVHGIKLVGTNYYHRGLNHPTNFRRGRNLRRVGCALMNTFNNSQDTANNVFVYSWSAKYNITEREKAAADLYNLLAEQVDLYHAKHKTNPKIRIIAFSEGGNVVLSMAKFADPQKLSIDEFIIMGTPIQEYTASLAKSPLFKRVLYLYSTGDIVQKIAPQLCFIPIPGCPHFSERRFDEQENIIQVETRIDGLCRGHFAFIQPAFIAMLPLIIETLNQWLDTAPKPENRPFYRLTVYTKERNR